MKTAFTLIEILIVVILLGILASIVVPQFASATDDARISACRTNVQTINTATALYRLRESAEPADIAALVATSPNNDEKAYLPAAPICGNQADGTNTYVIGTGCSLNCGD